MRLIAHDEIVERVLDTHRGALGADFDGYRHHVYRVANFFDALGPSRFDALGPSRFDATPALAIAAAFHDLGIWVDRTFDYLEPSAQLAQQFIEAEGLHDVDRELVRELVVQHHKLRPYRGAALVEQWRRADHVDVSLGVLAFGLPRSQIRQVRRRFPDRGFHLRLLQLTLREFGRHPLNPLPMIRW